MNRIGQCAIVLYKDDDDDDAVSRSHIVTNVSVSISISPSLRATRRRMTELRRACPPPVRVPPPPGAAPAGMRPARFWSASLSVSSFELFFFMRGRIELLMSSCFRKPFAPVALLLLLLLRYLRVLSLLELGSNRARFAGKRAIAHRFFASSLRFRGFFSGVVMDRRSSLLRICLTLLSFVFYVKFGGSALSEVLLWLIDWLMLQISSSLFLGDAICSALFPLRSERVVIAGAAGYRRMSWVPIEDGDEEGREVPSRADDWRRDFRQGQVRAEPGNWGERGHKDYGQKHHS